VEFLKSNLTRIRRLFLAAAGLFLLVFFLRWGYLLVFTDHDIIVTPPHFSGSFYVPSYRGRQVNIATEKISQADFAGNITVIDQKYEKTANISSVSGRFDEDHERLRALIGAHDAIVQTENLQGLPGSQSLSMTIGVVPQQFDDMVAALRELGTLRSFTVNRTDKTNEFNSLLAHQEVLRTTRASYAALQEFGGSIQDMLLLQERILVVETELQHLGVDLGIFATEHSFSTINLTLREHEVPGVSVQFVLRSAFNSFLWTTGAAIIASVVILGLLAAVTVGAWLRLQANALLKKSDSDEDA